MADPVIVTPPAPADARARHVERSARAFESLKEAVRTIVGALLIALVFRSFIVEPFNIPSGSMLSRLLVGDYLFVSKWPYGYSRYSFPFGLPLFEGRVLESVPERGDVIVFKNPADNRTDYIKRLIGLPGDQVQMTGGVLSINGNVVPKRRIDDFVIPVTPSNLQACGRALDTRVAGAPVCRYPRFEETLPGGRVIEVLDQYVSNGDDTDVFIVPQGHYFMMGDNRDDSADSRFSFAERGIGFVPAENLVGRGEVMFFSIDGTASWYKPWTWPGSIRWDRIGILL